MPDELATADEAFITGTAVEVTPIKEIGPYTFEVGEITRQLMADYDAEVLRSDEMTASASASAA